MSKRGDPGHLNHIEPHRVKRYTIKAISCRAETEKDFSVF